MREKLLTLLRLALLWFGLLLLARLLFIGYQLVGGLHITLGDFFRAMVYGMRMDLSYMGYIFLLYLLLWAVGVFISPRVFRRLFLALNGLLLTLTCCIIVADCELFRNWHSRIDLTPLIYLETPREALASTPLWSLILMLLCIALLSFLCIRLSRVWAWPIARRRTYSRWWHAPVFLFLAGTMIIPIRSSLSVAPINVASVAFSTNHFANQAAVNPAWNLIHDLLEAKNMYPQYPDYLTPAESAARMQELFTADTIAPRLLRTARPNIVVLLMESLSAKFTGCLGQETCTPRLDSLAQEGVLFTRLYAAGNRSDKGIIATLAGYPAQPKKSVIKYTRKLAKLPFLPGVLAQNGYNNTFTYGGTADFSNMRTALLLAGFQEIHDINSFPQSLRSGKWGVHDEYTFNALLEATNSAKPPFLQMLFTLTNHEPYALPRRHTDAITPGEASMRATAQYADSCLGDFIDKAKRQPWWHSTLVIVLADHGHRYPNNTALYAPETYHIPMLWLGGALRDSIPHRIETIASQVDLPATLLYQLGLPHGQFSFSRNILAHKAGSAYYAFNNGFGWVAPAGSFSYEHDARQSLLQEGILTDSCKKDGFAFFMAIASHYRNL